MSKYDERKRELVPLIFKEICEVDKAYYGLEADKMVANVEAYSIAKMLVESGWMNEAEVKELEAENKALAATVQHQDKEMRELRAKIINEVFEEIEMLFLNDLKPFVKINYLTFNKLKKSVLKKAVASNDE